MSSWSQPLTTITRSYRVSQTQGQLGSEMPCGNCCNSTYIFDSESAV